MPSKFDKAALDKALSTKSASGTRSAPPSLRKSAGFTKDDYERAVGRKVGPARSASSKR